YASGIFCVIGTAASVWNTQMTIEEPGLGVLRPLLRPSGYLSAMLVGAPAYLAMGWIDQNGLLSPWLEVLFAATAPVTALFCAHLFVRDWRPAISDTSGLSRARTAAT